MSEFVQTHEVLMTLVAIRLGIPKPILTLDGTSTNKATTTELVKDMLLDLHADELKVKRTIEEQIFIPACETVFGKDFEKIPSFFFNDFLESKEQRAVIVSETAKYVAQLTDAYLKLKQSGDTEIATKLLNFINTNIPVFGGEDSVEQMDIKEIKNDVPIPETIKRSDKEELPKSGDSATGDKTS